MAKVTIAIPVYNVENYIGRCIDSVLEQTLQDIEILVVNDATPDNSMDIVKEYANHDSRIRIIDNPQNRGLMATRQVGYTNATGDYITFLDSDDWLPNNAIELLYNKAVETEADIICGSIERTNGNGEYYGKWKCELPFGDDRICTFKAILNRNLSQNLCSKLFKRELLQNYKYVAAEHCTQAEDAGALFQFVDHANKVVAINEVVYYYYTNCASSSNNRNLQSMKCICEMTIIREKILAKYPELAEMKNKYFVENLYTSSFNKEYVNVIKEYGLGKYISFKLIYNYLNSDIRSKYFIKYFLNKVGLRKV